MRADSVELSALAPPGLTLIFLGLQLGRACQPIHPPAPAAGKDPSPVSGTGYFAVAPSLARQVFVGPGDFLNEGRQPLIGRVLL